MSALIRKPRVPCCVLSLVCRGQVRELEHRVVESHQSLELLFRNYYKHFRQYIKLNNPPRSFRHSINLVLSVEPGARRLNEFSY